MNSQQPAQDSGTVSRRVRRSEELLQQAAEYVSRGETFQNVSVRFDIPISTIRFYMARKGILPRRRRGRTAMLPYSVSHRLPMDTVMAVTGLQSGSASQQQYQQQLNENMAMASLGTSATDANQPTVLPRNNGSRSPSPSGPPFHFANYKLPEIRPNLM